MTIKTRYKSAFIRFVGTFVLTTIVIYFITRSTDEALLYGVGTGFGLALMVLLFGTAKSRIS